MMELVSIFVNFFYLCFCFFFIVLFVLISLVLLFYVDGMVDEVMGVMFWKNYLGWNLLLRCLVLVWFGIFWNYFWWVVWVGCRFFGGKFGVSFYWGGEVKVVVMEVLRWIWRIWYELGCYWYVFIFLFLGWFWVEFFFFGSYFWFWVEFCKVFWMDYVWDFFVFCGVFWVEELIDLGLLCLMWSFIFVLFLGYILI